MIHSFSIIRSFELESVGCLQVSRIYDVQAQSGDTSGYNARKSHWKEEEKKNFKKKDTWIKLERNEGEEE